MLKDALVLKITDEDKYAEEGQSLCIDEVAYTATPAIMKKGFAFKNVKGPKGTKYDSFAVVPKDMFFSDQKKFRIVAPAIIPDEPIYRFDDEIGEYYVVFENSVIESLFVKLGRDGKKDLFNQEHDKSVRAKSFILEKWIVGSDPKADKSYSEYGIEVPSGTVMLVTQFDDTELYEELVSKQMTGFSIEGLFGLKLSEIIKKERKMKQKFEMLKLEDGTPVWISSMAVDGEVYIVDENMDRAPIFDGEHKLEGGSIVVTVDGKITEVKPKAEAEALAEEDKPEEVPAEVKKEEMADEVIVADAPVVEDAPVEEVLTKEMIEGIVDGKLEEVYKAIGELKAMIEEAKNVEVAEDAVEAVALSRVQKMSKALNALNFNED